MQPWRTLRCLCALALLAASAAHAQDAPLWLGPTLRLPPPQEEAIGPEAPPEVLPPPSQAIADEAPAGVDPLGDGNLVLGEPAWYAWPPWLWDTAVWKPWEGSVELGLSGTEGNTQTFNVRAGFKAKHKTPRLVRTVELTSIQKSAEGVTTANTALLDGRLEWPMPQSRWNYYVHGLIEYDQFKAFEYRLSADTGLGFEFIQTETTTLIGRSGVSASQEIGGPEDDIIPELAFGGEFKHKFNPTHSISGKVDYFPSVLDFGDFRLNSQAGWEIALSSVWGLSLKLSVIDRYDSTPQGSRPNDLDYSVLLLWQF